MIKNLDFKKELNLMIGAYQLFDGLKNQKAILVINNNVVRFEETKDGIDYYNYGGQSMKANELIYKLIAENADEELLNHNVFPTGVKYQIKKYLWQKEWMENHKAQNNSKNLNVYYTDDRNGLIGATSLADVI